MTGEKEDRGWGLRRGTKKKEWSRMRRKHLNVISVTVFVCLSPFMSDFVRFLRRRRMRIGRWRTEKELYMRGLSRTEEKED